MLRELVIRRVRRSAEMIEREPETVARIFLDFVLLLAIGRDVLPGFGGREFSGRPVFVGRADEQNLVTLQATKARMNIRRQHRTGEIAEMLDAVDVRKRGGDQVAGHGTRYLGRPDKPSKPITRSALLSDARKPAPSWCRIDWRHNPGRYSGSRILPNAYPANCPHRRWGARTT